MGGSRARPPCPTAGRALQQAVLAGGRRVCLGARQLLELGCRLRGERRAVLDHRRGGVGRELAGAQLLRSAAQLGDQVVEALDAAHGMRAFSRTSRRTAASTPLTNAGASAPQKVFALSTASSIAPSGGIGFSAGAASGCSISISA